MTKERVKKQSYISLDPDVILFEPRFKRISEPEAFLPGGIDFYGTGEIAIPPQTSEKPSGAAGSAWEVLSEKFAYSIHAIDGLLEDRLDNVMDVLESSVAKTRSKSDARRRLFSSKFYSFKGAVKRNKVKSLVACSLIVCLMVMGLSVLNSFTVYEYSYYGNTLGYAQTKTEVFETIDLISEKINDEASAEIQFDKYNDVQFSKVVASDVTTDSQEEILDKFTYLRSMKANGVVITADGERKVLVENEETANKVLEAFKATYQNTANPNVEMESADFVENITIDPIEAEVLKLKNFDDALAALSEEDSEGKTAVSVRTSEIDIYNEPIPFETVYENSDEIYEGDTEVSVNGVNGQKSIVARVGKLNGEEESRAEISSHVASEPVNEVILVGTKERPSYMATGTYINPCEGRLSSPYGYRWGRTHEGIDIAAPYGTPIMAADSGTVSFSGSSSGYGLLVKIDHGNGTETRYGHCSKLLVSEGDKVLQGDQIALVGSTGRSTGNHCHFEIRINGTAINPLPYVNY